MSGIAGGAALIFSAFAFGQMVNSVGLAIAQLLGLAVLIWHGFALVSIIATDDSAIVGICVTGLAIAMLADRLIAFVRQYMGTVLSKW